MAADILKPLLEPLLDKLPEGFNFFETSYCTASITRSLLDTLIEKEANIRCYDLEPYDSYFTDLKELLGDRFAFRCADLRSVPALEDLSKHNVFILDPFNLNTLYPFNAKMEGHLRPNSEKTILVYNTCEVRQPGGAARHAAKLLNNPVCLGTRHYERRFGSKGPARMWSVWVGENSTLLN